MTVTAGPTQNYTDAGQNTWRARPVLAVVVRGGVALGPLLLALVVGAAAARWAPASRLGLPAAVWLLLVVGVAAGAVVVCSHWLRRLTPLSALLKLSLVLPDDVPHRFSLASRTWSPAALDAEAHDPDDRTDADAKEQGGAAWLLALVGTLAAHDARTRAHGERVQAYAALIGRELGLGKDDVDRLSWVALLHDVGKVHVPAKVINKADRPTEEEWAQLQQHPHHGGELVKPLRGWLGPWLDGVEQHHERWDGTGYPQRLSGEDISLAARIIAVADTYDVITSARAYKKPMSAEQARAEITRCAGEQFDPAVVRALLSVGIRRLRLVAGPATLLAALPVLVAAPAQAASSASAVAQVAGGHALTAVLAASVGVGGGVATEALAVPAPAPASAVADAVQLTSGSDLRPAAGPSRASRPTSTPGEGTTSHAPSGHPAGGVSATPGAAIGEAGASAGPVAPVPAAPPPTAATPSSDPPRPTPSAAPSETRGRGRTEEPADTGKADAAAKSAKDAADRAAKAAQEKAAKAAKDASDRAAKAAQDQAAKAAKDASELAAKAVKDQADQAAKAAKDASDLAAKAAKDQADQAAKAAKDASDQAAKAAKDQADQATKAAKDLTDQAAKAAKDLFGQGAKAAQAASGQSGKGGSGQGGSGKG